MGTDPLILKALSWLVDDACKRKLALTEEDERLREELREAAKEAHMETKNKDWEYRLRMTYDWDTGTPTDR